MKKQIFFTVVALLSILITAIGIYWYQKPRAGLANEKPAYEISAIELYNAFAENETKANRQFTGKVIRVKGIVEKVEATDSTLSVLLAAGHIMGGINCSVMQNNNQQQASPPKGKAIQIKGRCTGFLMDVNLIDALIED